VDQQRFTAANQATINQATKALTDRGITAQAAADTVADVVRNYNDSNRFTQALDSAIRGSDAYQSFKQVNVPTRLLQQTRQLNDQLYDQATGRPRTLTQSQLDSIVKQAQEIGAPIQQSYVDQIQTTINRPAQEAAAQAAIRTKHRFSKDIATTWQF
jgi:hypothetical protein